MAQIPWSVLSRQPIDAAAAARQMRICYQSIRKGCAAAEGNAPASALLQQETLRSLKAAHAALIEVIELEGKVAKENANQPVNKCFELLTVKGTAILPPCFWQVARLGVYRHLMGFLFKHIPEFEGVWLAFSQTRPAASGDTNVNSNSSGSSSKCKQKKGGAFGFLLPDLDCNDGAVFVSIETHALVFCPKVGDLITCKAQTVRPAVIRLLCLGHFTAVINREQVAGRFRYDEEAKIYVHRKDKKRRIEERSFVRLHVIDIPRSHSGDRIAIRGSLLAQGSGPISAAATTAAGGTPAAETAEATANAAERFPGIPEITKRKAPVLTTTKEEAPPSSHKRREPASLNDSAASEKQHARENGRN